MITLHRHLKYKLGGKSIFAKTTDLIKLTSRLTGVAIIAMLNTHQAIMDEIASVAVDAIENHSQDT